MLIVDRRVQGGDVSPCPPRSPALVGATLHFGGRECRIESDLLRRLVACLVQTPNEPIRYADMMGGDGRVWGVQVVGDGAVRSAVSRLRETLTLAGLADLADNIQPCGRRTLTLLDFWTPTMQRKYNANATPVQQRPEDTSAIVPCEAEGRPGVVNVCAARKQPTNVSRHRTGNGVRPAKNQADGGASRTRGQGRRSNAGNQRVGPGATRP